MAPTAAALLTAWEAGATEAPLDRAPSLLRTLGWLGDGEAVERLTVGQCDSRLYRLRRAVFGETVEAVATCPGCGAEVELEVSLSDLQPLPLAGEVSVSTIEAHGYQISCRPPANQDLHALAALGDAGLSDLLERCIVAAVGPDGETVSAHQIPAAVGEAVVEAVAATDPGAHVPLGVRCPCGREWVDELDIRAIVWTDLTDWVGRTLTEVHHLARANGWSEADILAMSTWRRRWYLEAAGW